MRFFSKKLLLASVFFLTMISFGVYASQLTWDTVSNGNSIEDGDGNREIGTTGFNDSNSSVVWNDNNDAIFGDGGVGGIVTISGTVSPNSLGFNSISGDYIITGGTIKLMNIDTQFNISNGVSPTIYSTISGTGGLLKLGGGTLTIGGKNTYTGNTVISEGTVVVRNNSAFGFTGSIYVYSGATLDISSLVFSGQDNIFSRTTIASGGNIITTIQTVKYDFESDTLGSIPSDISLEYTGILKVSSITGLNNKGLTVFSSPTVVIKTTAVLLNKFPTANDYSVIRMGVGSGISHRNGMILRGQATPYYKSNFTGARLGYLFQSQATSGKLQIVRISSGSLYQPGSRAGTITSIAPANTPRWYKASVVGSGLIFAYSDISNKGPRTQVISVTDTTYTGGYTQYTDAWGSKPLNAGFIDDVTMQYNNITTVIPDKLNKPILLNMSDTSATFNLVGLGQIEEYILTANPGSIVATGNTSTITISGLSPNTIYGFTAIAKNSAGYGEVSDIYTGTTTSSISAIISYSTTGATSGDVTATLTGLSGATITNNGGSNIYTFTGNGSFTFTYTQGATTGSAVATVNRIDKIAPTATINYSTTGATSGNVIATLTGFSESITITNNGGSSGYTFTENGSFIFNFIDQVGNIGSSTAIVNWINNGSSTGNYSITLINPVQYQVIQRDKSTNKGDILIVGTYTGDISGIEASWNGGVFTNISATMLGGVFTGILANQNPGQGMLVVRASNNTGTLASVANIGIGDIFVVAGQSNAAGWGANPQTFTGTNGISATLFGNDYTWKLLRDPYDDDTNQIDTVSLDAGANGSFVPLLATKIISSQNIPVAFVPTAMGGTQITSRAPGADHFDRSTLYGSMTYRIKEVGGKIAGVIRFQGESDAMMKRTTAAYMSGLNNIINTLQGDFSGNSIKFFIGSIGPNNYSGYAIDAIRKAQQEIYLGNTYVYPNNALTYDINLADEGGGNLHFRSNGELEAFSERRWNVIAKDYYELPVNTPPRILSTGIVFFTKTNSLILSFDMPIASQVPSIYTNNLSGITYLTGSTESFGISGSNMFVQSVSLSGSNTLILELSGSFTGGAIYLNYANGVSGVNKSIYSETSYQPAYPIYSQSISIVENTAPTVILNGSGSITLNQGDIYIEEGARRTDNIDGSGTNFTGDWGQIGSFAISGNINTNITGTHYIQYNKVDSSGNITIVTRTINILSGIPIIGTITYSSTGDTSGNVITTLSLNKTGTITNNLGNNTYTFTDNGVFTFNFVDGVGNTGSATATVNRIDKTKPTASIFYSTTGATNGNIVVNLTGYSESIVITNNGGSYTYTFTGNSSFTFNFVDGVGNTGSTTATVNRIDLDAIIGTITYSTTGSTSGNIIATLSLNKTGTITNNGGSNTYNFTDNGSFTFNFVDGVGNTGSTTATVNWIDKTKPTASISYSTTGATNGNVIVKLTGYSESIVITNNGGSNTYTFTGNGSFKFTFRDNVGNTGSATSTVNWIEEIIVVDSQNNGGDNKINGTGKIVLTGGTSTGVTFNWSGTIVIKELDSVGSLELNTSGVTIIASGDRDMSLLAPIKILATNDGYAEFGEPGIPSRTESDKTRDILTTIEAGSTGAEITITGGENFRITIIVDSGNIGQELKIYRSNDGYNRLANEPDKTCILSGDKSCSFYTNHLSYFTAIKETISSGGGGGGGEGGGESDSSPITTKDICPNGDFTNDKYDGRCGTANTTTTGSKTNTGYSSLTGNSKSEKSELEQAYDFAYKYGITTKKTSKEANLTGVLIRIDLAKMIVNYASNVLLKIPDPLKQCTFNDLGIMSEEMKTYAIKSCQLGLMGVNTNNKFNPNRMVTRAEFGTILSRLLRGEKYNSTSPIRYKEHLNALKEKLIMKNISNPTMKELRGYVMLMLMRTK